MAMTTINPDPIANSKNAIIHIDLSPHELIQYALQSAEGELATNQALVVKTGKRTGRSPKDRFIVQDKVTTNTVEWNTINQPFNPQNFAQLWAKANAYLHTKPEYFVANLKVGAHATYGIPVRVITELAWHNLFATTLFIREDTSAADENSRWTILCVPGFIPNSALDGVNSDAAIILNFTQRQILICGTQYAGEIKKAMFSVLNFLLPAHNILPMHCAANTSSTGETALFFGLSGTGKTTLSADPNRLLIGDDEHGWGEDGIFNFEGGCYAKCIDLSEEREPIIWNAIRYGTVIENVVLDPITKNPNYADSTITQNTRAAYPREFISNRALTNNGAKPKTVIFLTCDLYGVLPPVARLTTEQAAYYFLSGYTALVGSTEVGQGGEIKPTFSTCFGAPFFPRHPSVYAELLIKRLQHDQATVYLVNTGWTGGAYGQGGMRFSIPTTRAIISSILDGKLTTASFEILPYFNLQIPTALEQIESRLLNPRNNWPNRDAYDAQARTLISQFIANFKNFAVSDAIRHAGPQLT